jgi:hypothetical protein
MTAEAHAARIQVALGANPPRNKRLPIDFFIPFFEDLWKSGVFPSGPLVQQWLPGYSVQSLGMACFEWRSRQGIRLTRLKPKQKPPSLEDLVPLIDATIAAAHHTCFDPQNDGRWSPLPGDVVHLLLRLENASLRNVMTLYSAIKIQTCTPHFVLCKVRTFARIMGRLMLETGVEDVTTINPNILLFQVWNEEIGLGFNRPTRQKTFGAWTGIQHTLEEYSESLRGPELEGMRAFFLKSLTSRNKLSIIRPEGSYSEEQRERAKRKSDAVQAHFYRLRHVAAMRVNQVARIYRAVINAIALVETGKEHLPYTFSYQEPVPTSDREASVGVNLKLWDTLSLFDHAVSRGMRAEERVSERAALTGHFADERRGFLVEYLRPASPGFGSEPFWFLDVLRHHLFEDIENKADAGVVAARREFCQRWGYPHIGKWGDNSCLLLSNDD